MAEKFVLAIDQGTTSSRAMLFDAAGAPRGLRQIELPQIYPAPGWVEHDPERIWTDTLACCLALVEEVGRAAVVAIGITNQRETVVLWDRATGKPLANAIVWQDRRTAALCESLRGDGLAPAIAERTGLVIDPYFSGTKLAWLLENVPGARDRAARGKLAFGTIDSFLLWRLTGGRVHATDATNAARTMLFDIRRQQWDDELLRRLRIPHSVLPEVRDSVGAFGTTAPELFGGPIPITGIAGDQQAATFGQAAFEPGAIKSTYGTGCFVLLNTGDRLVPSRSGLLSTIGWRLDGHPTYALEGSIFVAGAAVQWLRDGLGIIRTADETEGLARSIPDTGGVYLVPAFVGLGAPWWDADARAALVGVTRDTGRAQIARAALESIAYQTRDLFAAMAADGAPPPSSLKVDGGLVRNDWAMQFLADILDLPVDRPAVTETTALGAARLAGWGAGFYPSIEAMSQQWRLDRQFVPTMRAAERERLCAGWRDAVERALSPARRSRRRN